MKVYIYCVVAVKQKVLESFTSLQLIIGAPPQTGFIAALSHYMVPNNTG